MSTQQLQEKATSVVDVPASLPQALYGLVEQAVEESATDIHIDAWGTEASLRFRVDGTVHQKDTLTYDQSRKLINQIKVAAGLELPAAYRPQEGHFRWLRDDMYRDVRVTVVSTAPRHEAAHLRLLTPPEHWRDVRNLGLSDRDFELVERTFQNAHGLVLISGPTGSGKTTTLYSLTGLTDLRQQIAVSIENPTEYDLPYVRQLEVNEKHGFTMEEGLQTILRLDPDIVLVGEVRDAGSARITARAALAGRLVLASIHARDPAIAVEAMHYLSVPYYVLGGALRLVIAQDLIRTLCPECRRPRSPNAHERLLFEQAELVPPDSVFDAVGCPECHGYGYRGRTGVFQVVAIDDAMGNWLVEGPHQQAIRERMFAVGSRSLNIDALRKAAAGTTSMNEVLRFYGQVQDRPLVIRTDAK
ncbi:MAG: Flp pilus assembly complex ATPase component TadA [Pirellulales bacterium]|nr:Flp pilus assembly complex ATPase component TadA [Pirellulales bacterium]